MKDSSRLVDANVFARGIEDICRYRFIIDRVVDRLDHKLFELVPPVQSPVLIAEIAHIVEANLAWLHAQVRRCIIAVELLYG